jgi:hypothetical protein
MREPSSALSLRGSGCIFRGGKTMYEDGDLWPIKCFECKEEFFEEVGRIKTGERIKCPGINCTVSIRYPPKQFELTVAQRNAGVFDPFRDMLILKKPAKSG